MRACIYGKIRECRHAGPVGGPTRLTFGEMRSERW